MKNEEPAEAGKSTAAKPASAADKPQDSQKPMADFDFERLELSIEQMLKSGVHFGHKKARWNPKTRAYVFAVRNDVSIIDLEKTKILLEKALEFLRGVVRNGGKILFVGTKPQAKNLIEQLAVAVDMPYVSNRWLGGTFTNFSEIRRRLKYLNDQEAKFARGDLSKYTKYEQLQFMKEIARMNEKMGGLKKMEGLPQAVLVADLKENQLAAKEAALLKIPVVGIVDTNVDPELATHPIPGNDDALSSLKYLLGIMAKAIKEAKAEAKTAPAQTQEGAPGKRTEKNHSAGKPPTKA